VLAITGKPFPLRFDGPAADMWRALASDAGPMVRLAVANEWLFAPLLKRTISATPAGASMLHTTIAPTMLRGSPKANVLPQDAAAWINYRIAPGNTADEVMQRAREATRGLAVDLTWDGVAYDPSPVSSIDSAGYRLLAALAGDDGRIPVAPGLVTAATDSRAMTPIATDIYRFQPIVASLREFEMIHGTNEHLTLDNLRRTVEFYARLIASAAR
jgi:carboxypeptidase PM20D1